MDKWYEQRSELLKLVRYLAWEGYTAQDIVSALEKPWNWNDEHDVAVAGQECWTCDGVGQIYGQCSSGQDDVECAICNGEGKVISW